MSTIGLGATLEVNDGSADAFVAIDGITSMSVADTEIGVVESKRLDLTARLLGKIKGLTEPGQFTFTYEFTKAAKARLDALLGTSKNWKFTLPEGSPSWTRTAPGFLVSNKQDPVEADGIMTVTAVVQVNGALS